MRKFDAHIGGQVRGSVNERIEAQAKKFQVDKSEIIRRSLDIALPKFEKSNRLPQAVVPQEEGGAG
jgi:hypothetical protein